MDNSKQFSTTVPDTWVRRHKKISTTLPIQSEDGQKVELIIDKIAQRFGMRVISIYTGDADNSVINFTIKNEPDNNSKINVNVVTKVAISYLNDSLRHKVNRTDGEPTDIFFLDDNNPATIKIRTTELPNIGNNVQEALLSGVDRMRFKFPNKSKARHC